MTKNSMQNKHIGFTILEIMIVLAIIAIMSGVVVMNVSSSTYGNFVSQANKVAAMLEVLGDNAVYTNSVIACDANTNGLDCQRYKNGEWVDVTLSSIVAWQWPEGMKIEQVLINGLPMKQNDKIRFVPDGNTIPMSIRVGNGAYNTWIDNDLSGNYKISN